MVSLLSLLAGKHFVPLKMLPIYSSQHYLIIRHRYGKCSSFALELCKGKSVPLQAWSGPEGSKKLRFPDFMTTAQGGGKVVSLTHRPHLPPGNSPGTHFC